MDGLLVLPEAFFSCFSLLDGKKNDRISMNRLCIRYVLCSFVFAIIHNHLL